MSEIGADIKEVLQELGTTTLIYRTNGSTFSELGDIEAYPEHSSEFTRQFFSLLTLAHDTNARNGDIIESSGTFYVATNVIPSYFEDGVVDNSISLFKCNVNGVLKRPSVTTDPTDYVQRTVFTIKAPNPSSIRALEYENKFNAGPVFAEETQFFLRERHILVLPGGIDAAVGDRWYPVYTDTTKYFRIETVDVYRFPGCMICGLTEDTR